MTDEKKPVRDSRIEDKSDAQRAYETHEGWDMPGVGIRPWKTIPPLSQAIWARVADVISRRARARALREVVEHISGTMLVETDGVVQYLLRMAEEAERARVIPWR